MFIRHRATVGFSILLAVAAVAVLFSSLRDQKGVEGAPVETGRVFLVDTIRVTLSSEGLQITIRVLCDPERRNLIYIMDGPSISVVHQVESCK